MMTRSRYGALGRLVQCLAALSLLGAAAPAPKPRLIWAFGDSLTAGYGLPPNQGFTAQLQAALDKSGTPATVRNGGVSGDTAAQGRARLLWGLRGLGAKPDLVIVELGANDMLRGAPVAQVEANLDIILKQLKARQIRVLLAGMRAAPNMGPAYVRGFEAIYPRLARRYGVALYPFFIVGAAGHRDLIQADWLHPNARGVAVVVKRIVPAVQAALR